MMLTTGIGVLAAALPIPEARAYPGRMPPPSAPSGQAGSYIFSDEFDGPAGSAPDPSKWTATNVIPAAATQAHSARSAAFAAACCGSSGSPLVGCVCPIA